jgi:hypothetical protein
LSCVTTVGGYGQTYVPGFQASDTDVDVRFGLKVVDPRIYIGVGYLWHEGNYGYPRTSGVGFGIEKLPDLDHVFSVYGSLYYYPSVSGNFQFPGSAPPGLAGTVQSLSYRDLLYQGGVTFTLGKFDGLGVFLDANYLGDNERVKNLAPSSETHSGAAVGIGVKF